MKNSKGHPFNWLSCGIFAFVSTWLTAGLCISMSMYRCLSSQVTRWKGEFILNMCIDLKTFQSLLFDGVAWWQISMLAFYNEYTLWTGSMVLCRLELFFVAVAVAVVANFKPICGFNVNLEVFPSSFTLPLTSLVLIVVSLSLIFSHLKYSLLFYVCTLYFVLLSL